MDLQKDTLEVLKETSRTFLPKNGKTIGIYVFKKYQISTYAGSLVNG